MNVSGVFPHLAQVADLGPPRSEIGVGCLMPWTGKLYVLNYLSHKSDAGASGRAFNIAAAEPTSHDEGSSIVAEAFSVPRMLVEMPTDWRLELTIDAARDSPGYRPRYDYGAMVHSAEAGPDSGNASFVPARLQPSA